MKNKIVELLNVGYTGSQSGRVYSTNGIAPALDTRPGGDVRIIVNEDGLMNILGGFYSDASKNFQRGILKNTSRCLKATIHDASIIYKESGGCQN